MQTDANRAFEGRRDHRDFETPWKEPLVLYKNRFSWTSSTSTVTMITHYGVSFHPPLSTGSSPLPLCGQGPRVHSPGEVAEHFRRLSEMKRRWGGTGGCARTMGWDLEGWE